MRSLAGARLALVASVVAAALLAMPAVAAADREYSFAGPQVRAPECNQDLRVGFHALLHKGRFKRVTDFMVKNMNFPNSTPPVPFGKPTGNCYPYEPSVVFLNYHLFLPAAMPFNNPDHPSEFRDSDKQTIHGLGDPVVNEAWVVDGKVSLHRRHHRFHVKAKGYLGFATSEAGLDVCSGHPCGASSGKVHWKAKGHEVSG